VYQITEDGAREMTDWLSELVAEPAKEYPQFMAGLSFLPALAPEDATEALRQRSQALEIRLAQHRAALRTATDAGLPRLFSIESEFETAMADAELHFVQGLLKELADGALEGLDMWRGFYGDEQRGPPALPQLSLPVAEVDELD
jgi:hypothetical protein